MARTIFTVLFTLFFLNAMAQEQGDEGYGFNLYVLAKGKMKKAENIPDFAWRIKKSYPYKIREFTFPSVYMDNSAPIFKSAAEEILSSIPENRRKNAVVVSGAVFEYVEKSISGRQVTYEFTDNHHRVYFSALQALNEKRASEIEKCRLCVALLRLLDIPARTVYRQGRYVVEYYLLPLAEKGKGGWHIRELGMEGAVLSRFFVPPDWHALDSSELLNESWKEPLILARTGQRSRFFAGNNETVAAEFFASVSEAGAVFEESAAPDSGIFCEVRETSYEAKLPAGVKSAAVEIALPFNLADDYKTIKYSVKAASSGIEVKAKWPQTRIKQAQDGMIYSLPVSISLKED